MKEKNYFCWLSQRVKNTRGATAAQPLRYLCAMLLVLFMGVGNVLGAENTPKSTKNPVIVLEKDSSKEGTKIDIVNDSADAKKEGENIGLKLSGDYYTLRLIEENKETNWTVIIAIISIIANILVVILTYVLQTRLKHLETKEIRTQNIQEVEVKKQADMYQKLKDIDNFMSAHENSLWPDAGEGDAELKRQLNDKIIEAENFHQQNTLYIRGKIGKVTANLLAQFKKKKDGDQSAEVMNNIQKFLKDYVDVYHNHPELIQEKSNN